jgi:hypothetical protein
VTVATGTQAVNAREAAAEREIYDTELVGAQQAAADAEARKEANIESGFSSAGDLAGNLDSLLGDDKAKNKAKSKTVYDGEDINPYDIPEALGGW